MNTTPSLPWVLLFGLSTPALTVAQIAPAPATLTPTESPAAVVLNPFVVNTDKDTGYQAVDSLVGGRISTELMKTPSDVTVLTKEFLDDIGATSYLDAGPYLTNAVVPDRTSTGQDRGDGLNFRGVAGGVAARNYFKSSNATDFYIVDRLEGARGPNAILFGDGVLGGIVNTTTKTAQFGKPITTFTVRADSEGSLRGTADVNRVVGKNLAVRVNVLKTAERIWRETYFNDRDGAHVAVTLRPWSGGELRAEGEYGYIHRNRAPSNFADQSSLWNGVPFNAASTTLPAGSTGLSRFATDRLTLSPSIPRIINLLNFGMTTGTAFSLRPINEFAIPNLPTVSKELIVQPPNIVATNRYLLGGLTYDHRWSDRLSVQVAFQYAYYDRFQDETFFGNYRVDPNRVLPDGTANPKFNQPFADAQRNLRTDDTEQVDWRAAAVYTLPVQAWTQRLNLMATRRFERFEDRSDRFGRTNHPTVLDLQNAVNQVFYNVYLYDPILDLPDPQDDANYKWAKYRRTHSYQETTLDSVQLATVAQFFGNKVTVVGGVRHDALSSWQKSIATRDVRGTPLTFGREDIDAEVTKYSGGFTYFPVPQLGAYVNYSQTFNAVPAGFANVYGRAFAPTQGEGYSGGLRFNLFDRRVVGSIGYYNSEEAGRIAPAALTGITEINRIWTNLSKNQNTFIGIRDTTDYSAWGYEFDVVANVTKQLRLRGNFALPKTELSNSIPALKQYFDANLPEWQRAASNPNQQGQSSIVTDIQNLRNRINSSADHRRLDGSPDYSGSIYGHYTFDSGRLNRLGIGLGATFTGPLLLGNQTDRPYDYVFSELRFLANATLSYRFKIAARAASLQLNVYNLLGDNKPVFTSVRPFNGTVYRNGFYYNEPRKFIFTATIEL
jgi:iron complex outermembrane recepter protein